MLKSKRISVLISRLAVAAVSVGMMFGIPAAYAAGNGTQEVETAEAVGGTEQKVLGDAAVYAAYTGSVSLGVNAMDGQEVPELERSGLSELEITVSAYGAAPVVERIDAYINDELKCSITEQPYILDISDSSLGINTLKLLAFDAEGNQVSEYTHKFALVSTEKQLIYESDFSSGAGELSFDGVAGMGGYYDISEVDSEHGKSVVISSDSKDINDMGPYVHVMAPSATGTYETEMDFCVLEGDAEFHLSWRNSINGSRIEVVRFSKDGKINLLGTGGTEELGKLTTYEKGRWYNIRMIFYAATRTYDLYINDELQIKGRTGQGAAATQGVSLLRFIMDNPSDSKASIALDNVKMYLMTKSLYITGAASESNRTAVKPNAEKIYLFLSNSISGEGLEKHITLNSHIGKVPINNITYDSAVGAIVIEPGTKIQSSVKYVVKVAKGLPLTDGKMLVEDMYGRFTVAPDDLDIKEVYFKNNNGKVSVTAEYEHSLDDVIVLKAVINIWREGSLERASVSDLTLFPGGIVVSVGQYTLEDGERMEIHFVEAFDRHGLVTANTYEYAMN